MRCNTVITTLPHIPPRCAVGFAEPGKDSRSHYRRLSLPSSTWSRFGLKHPVRSLTRPCSSPSREALRFSWPSKQCRSPAPRRSLSQDSLVRSSERPVSRTRSVRQWSDCGPAHRRFCIHNLAYGGGRIRTECAILIHGKYSHPTTETTASRRRSRPRS